MLKKLFALMQEKNIIWTEVTPSHYEAKYEVNILMYTIIALHYDVYSVIIYDNRGGMFREFNTSGSKWFFEQVRGTFYDESIPHTLISELEKLV